VNIESGELQIFDNRKTHLTIDHILTSGSLPPGFQPIEINRKRYWDGSLFDNSPFVVLLRSLENEDLFEQKNGDSDPPVTAKRLITVELFPRSGDFPRNLVQAFGRIVELQDRVKVDTRAISNIYEYAVLLNWLSRFLRILVQDSGGTVTPDDIKRFTDSFEATPAPDGERRGARRPVRRPDDPELVRFRANVVTAGRQALEAYFNQARPDRARFNKLGDDCVYETAAIPRIADIQQVGLQQLSIASIVNFANQLGSKTNGSSSPGPGQDSSQVATDDQNKQFIKAFGSCPLITNQVSRFSNIELLPLKTSVPSALLGPADFSASAIRDRYQAGLKVAEEQIVVAEFHDNQGNTFRDLKFVAPPDES
jgi:hypothetical protein